MALTNPHLAGRGMFFAWASCIYSLVSVVLALSNYDADLVGDIARYRAAHRLQLPEQANNRLWGGNIQELAILD
jgi:hypothetical protein